MNLQPLSGIKVLDLTRLLPGPLCTLYLAQLGAEVIKIEPPEGDYVRFIPPLAKKNSFVFLQLNQHKKLRSLDLKAAPDREEILKLVADAQVLVESFRPGVMAELGLSYEELKKINPALIYCSITGYGQTGPYKDRPGHDMNYLATAGVLEQMPGLANFQIADVAGGSLSSCVGILATLLRAQKTGEGCFIDVAMLDCTLALNHVALATYQGTGRDIGAQEDLLSGGFPFYALYETSDQRRIALGTLEQKFWKNFCLAIGRPEWVPWHTSGKAQYPQIALALRDLFRSKTLREWTELLADKDCCVSPLLRPSEVKADPQVRARGLLTELSTAEDGTVTTFAFPLRFQV